MDSSDPEITFNKNGICNHCMRYDEVISSRINIYDKDKKVKKLVDKIKKSSSASEYDCIIGVSGGVDSTYVAYLCKELGLKPLAIHFDNGWNSELSVKNIENCLDFLNIDLVTYVIEWDYYKEIQKAFLYSSTPDGEIPTDHAINALLFNEAKKRGLKFIINGMNFATESMNVRRWSYGHSDWKYIKHIIKRFSNINKFKNYPHFSLLQLILNVLFYRIKVVSILNYIDYNKENAMELIKNKLNWVYYGGKHYESIYTRFYQGYFLPNKFGIDKRRGHFSDLIRSKQMTRKEAIKLIKKDPYPDESLKAEDLEYVLKKFELSSLDFNNIMEMSKKSFLDYPNNHKIVDFLKKCLNFLRRKNLYSK
tara:strand:- start:12625 stop:13719 length:1095 start_codon:yes stop_codon:yes gene_type:complete